MTNILFTLIVALGMKIADSNLSPKHYLITYQDGQREEVVLSKDNHICPSYCSIQHAHKVSICNNNECETINKSFIINKQKSDNNTFNLYCNGKEIMLFEEIKRNYSKKKPKSNSIKLF